jgi:EAL domain-containing protein (putative c-di-GMP-specific phosphodiesterase class I)/CheY-like chemotaxis protein
MPTGVLSLIRLAMTLEPKVQHAPRAFSRAPRQAASVIAQPGLLEGSLGRGLGGQFRPASRAVLVVDDDPDQLELALAALWGAGLPAVGVASAEAALETIAVEPIGCVVADLRMPGMSGIDLVRTIRDRPETSTMPVILITGFGESGGAITALGAGADDFMIKTVGLEEIVARVHAHLRTQAAWTQVVVAELQTRADAIQAISQLALSSVPEDAAQAIVGELGRRIGCEFVGVYRLVGEYHLEALATWTATDGLVVGGSPMASARSRYLVDRARHGPWAERLSGPELGERTAGFWDAKPDLAAAAPIFAGEALVGLLAIADVAEDPMAPSSMLRARLLASATDYASVLGAVAGPAIANRRQAAIDRAELRRVLTGRAFSPVFQPIVKLSTRGVVGYEALTRFTDRTNPEARFERAAAAGLGFEFELAAIDAALKAAPTVVDAGFLSLNVSPGLLVMHGKRLRRALARWRGEIVLEVTEHAPIANYDAFRAALGRFRRVELAIDDAGAGYNSLRHILELGAAWVKLDITLVRGIDHDPLRQALVAGLARFGKVSGQHVIAEGVERQQEADTLLDLGVEFGQGYLFGRPRATHRARPTDDAAHRTRSH